MFRHLLWMHDLSTRADAALHPIVALARGGRSAVTVATALGATVPLEADGSLPEGSPVVARARAHLVRIEEELARHGIQARIQVAAGRPEALALRAIQDDEVDLVVAGSSGVAGLDRLLLGSTARKLVRELPTSVLVVGRRPFKGLGKLLSAIDVDSPTASLAISRTADVSRAVGALPTWLSVVEAGSGAEDLHGVEARLRTKVQQELGGALPPGWSARATVDETSVAGILREANNHDLVVMTTAGRRGIQRLLLGSVTEEVVEACPVSVLVVR